MTVQLSREGAVEAVERRGPSILAALSEAGATLTAEQMHAVRTADREGRAEMMAVIAAERPGPPFGGPGTPSPKGAF